MTDHKIIDTDFDPILATAKRKSHERSHKLVREGKRTQESMFLIPREIARAAKVHYK